MPQTVPNSPTNGAHRPDRRQNAGAARHPPHRRRLDPGKQRGDPFLDAVVARGVAGALQLAASGARQHGDVAVGLAQLVAALPQRQRLFDEGEVAPQPALGAGEFDGLGQPHRPGQHRRKGESDHHRLHDLVGGHEHADRRQIVRQDRLGLDRGLGHGGGRRHRRGGDGSEEGGCCAKPATGVASSAIAISNATRNAGRNRSRLASGRPGPHVSIAVMLSLSSLRRRSRGDAIELPMNMLPVSALTSRACE